MFIPASGYEISSFSKDAPVGGSLLNYFHDNQSPEEFNSGFRGHSVPVNSEKDGGKKFE